MDHVLTAVERQLAIEKTNKEKLVLCSKGITRAAFATVEAFPLDESGRLVWHSGSELLEVRKRISRFFEYDATFSDGRAHRMWPQYLALAFPWMQGWPLEEMLTALVVRTWYHRSLGNSTLQSVEFFCGSANLSLAAVEAGLTTAAVDKDLNPEHDVLEPHGLILWLSLLTATLPGALEWLGSPCNSYVVLCRSQSLRTAANNFLGDESRYFVLEGNCLGDISALMFWLGAMVLLRPALEQPANSVLPLSGCVAGVLQYLNAEKTMTYHYCFGGATLKPLQLWGTSSSFLRALQRSRPAGFTQGQDEGLVSRDDQGGFTGDKERLKESQAYSKQFGRAIIQAFLSHNS